ncbi:tyrosinase family protein [Massilia sp. ML15P13]|uniref:Tyrosinase family protein n=1 Tax=Telluria aromaticivorans TaxID=2725995 RepID=A0A7Y2K220_9BURK|nr:tyrosinase family protein [Telluria aromaticivorans]
MYHFERQLRIVSGDSNLILPYWDYYTYATIPAEFTDPNSTNPLYVNRLNVNVRQALTLAPFSPTVTNFQRGAANAFEPILENQPHNPVHDIIGNIMSTMNSPVDPIFWLHHANVDRLWVAWITAAAGRKMPAKTKPYWSGVHTYTNTLTLPRVSTYDTRTILQYYYQNEAMPASIPLAQVTNARALRVQAGPDQLPRSLPPTGSFKISGPRPTSAATFSLGGALHLSLDRRSISAQLPVNPEHWTALQEIGRGKAMSLRGGTTKYKSAHLVLDQVELAENGKNGGYFYQVYLNMPSPEAGASRPTSLLLGTLGAFQIRSAVHHGHGAARLRYSLRGILPNASLLRVGMVSVSFVRVDGDNNPAGAVIGIGEAHLELSTEETNPQ